MSDRLNMLPALLGFASTRAERLARWGMGTPALPDARHAYPPPDNDDEWADLAEDVHADRAERIDHYKVLMGGAVNLLEVTADGIDRREVHRFTDADRDRMLRGTIHPSQQLGPCVCGSGVRMLECHFREVADDPCLCRSGRTFASCCMVTPLEDLADDPHAPTDVSDRHQAREPVTV